MHCCELVEPKGLWPSATRVDQLFRAKGRGSGRKEPSHARAFIISRVSILALGSRSLPPSRLLIFHISGVFPWR
jgi:hypothetical protein